MNETRTCPRCAGYLALVEDIGDRYFSCVQCGFLRDAVAPKVRISA